jgi:hypothetical protein
MAMRQDKDRSGKWLIGRHGDAILRLGGLTDFIAWKAVPPETVAPRRLPDGLLEVRFPGEPDPRLVLVEIETYPDRDVARQVLDDLMLLAVERRAVPEVVSLVLRPKGRAEAVGRDERTSPSGRTTVGGSWPVVRMWELDAADLLAAGDVGLIPWVPLARTDLPPEELLARCRDRIAAVPDPTDRAGLMAVTHILARLAYPSGRFLDLFGGLDVMIESPVLDEVKEIIRRRERTDAVRDNIVAFLEARFGTVPADVRSGVVGVTDPTRLEALVRLAATCPDVAAFAAGLASGS